MSTVQEIQPPHLAYQSMSAAFGVSLGEIEIDPVPPYRLRVLGSWDSRGRERGRVNKRPTSAAGRALYWRGKAWPQADYRLI